MLFSRTFYSIMFLHSFLIIISFRLNLETDSLSHKLKARVPCKGWGIFIISMFSFSLLVSAFSLGINVQKAQISAIITYVIMKICLYLYRLFF